jgi:hypothetical protein
MANFYIFFRRWQQDGQDLRQQITVYANDLAEARQLLAEDLRQHGGSHGGPPTQSSPTFEAKELTLDQPKVLTHVFTTR